LRADAENGRERRGASETKPVMIDLVFKPGIAGCIRSRVALENDRTSVGKN
jgi:hypothetical protein